MTVGDADREPRYQCLLDGKAVIVRSQRLRP